MRSPAWASIWRNKTFMSDASTAYSPAEDSARAGAELADALGEGPWKVVIFFAFIDHDGAAIGDALKERFQDAHVIGCSGNGQFGNAGHGKHGASAVALSSAKVASVASAMAPLTDDVESGVVGAAKSLSDQLGQDLRELDPSRFVGIVLAEGATCREEKINEALGNVAPKLEFVGGSAGDDIKFQKTWVYVQGRVRSDASALMVLEPTARFAILKTCNYLPTDQVVTVTKLGTNPRLVEELDGVPATKRYAEIAGCSPEELDFPHFLAHPLGLMIDDKPWLRSVAAVKGNALFFACSILDGMELSVMRGDDLVADTRRAFDEVQAVLGCQPRAAILFNCAYRMIEADVTGTTDAYHAALNERVVHAGLYSNGESYLGHMNQTLVGLVLG